MLYLSNADVESLLDMPTTLEALRAGYADLARGDAAYIPRVDIYAPTGRDEDYYRWGSMTGVCRATGVVAIRIKSDVVYWPDGKTEEKYCIEEGTYSGVILCYSTRNGEPLALINDGYLQHMRVGACAGLGAGALARPEAEVVGLIGSGGMARTYLSAFAQVRKLRQVKVYSPNRDHREAFAEEMTDKLGLEIVPVDGPEKAIRGSHIVATATDSMSPTFDAAWLEPGMHVTCVTRRELGREIVGRADVRVQLGIHSVPVEFPLPGMSWPSANVAAYVVGQPEERARIPMSATDQATQWTNLVDIETGQAAGRTSADQISLFVNTGTQGLQFAAVAGRVVQLAQARGLGQAFPTEWFLQDIRD
jgi:ornithine cyclodeaminase/alanine dehydrogenase-like protein (mu-crystallin family)